MRQKEHVPAAIYGLSLLLQLICVPAAILFISFVMGSYCREVMRPYRYLDAPADLLYYILPDVIGFGMGYLVRLLPAAVREPARWVWVLPFALFLGVFVGSWFYNLHHFFYAFFGTQGADYEGFGILRLIFPVGAFCLYSIEALGGDKQVVRVDETGHPL